MALTYVNQPIKLGNLEIKNRVVRTAHLTNMAKHDGIVSEALVQYHLARARGGVGLSMVEVLAVHPSAVGTSAALDYHAPGIGGSLRKLVDTIRPHGMKLIQQLHHGGVVVAPLDGSPGWSVDDRPGALVNAPVIAVTKPMVDTLVDLFGRAAGSCEEWGLDGVEVNCAHGYLMSSFASPIKNRREDGYGGPFENRARIFLEVFGAIRASVSKGFPVGIRMSPDRGEGGVTPELILQIFKLLKAHGLIDYVNLSCGDSSTSVHKAVGGMHEAAGYELPTSIRATANIGLPRIVIGRFGTLEEADQIIRAGDADMVGMVRALIADPDVVQKTLAGHPERVRPCIACNQSCIGNISVGAPLGCAVNPAVGFEAALDDNLLQKASQPKRILVVGGGPAGLEAARVAALRGHKVVLAEATARLGGTIRIAALTPTRQGIADIATWLEAEVYRLGVEVRLNTPIDAEQILADRPDAVILATGATPRLDGVQLANLSEPGLGMNQSHVLSSRELLLDAQRNLGKTAVVVDDVGHFEAVGVTEYLVSKGIDVTFVTRHISFAPHMEPALMNQPALERIGTGKGNGRLNIMTRTRLLSVGEESAVLCPTYLYAAQSIPEDSSQLIRVPAETVVFISHNKPNNELVKQLDESGIPVTAIGDANAPRFLAVAMREGRQAGIAA